MSTNTSGDLGRQAYRHQANTSLYTVDVVLHESSSTIVSMADDCSRLVGLVFVSVNVLADDWST